MIYVGDSTQGADDQAEFQKPNQEDLYAILFPVTEKPASLLLVVKKHAQNIRGTRGNGQVALRELEWKHLKSPTRQCARLRRP